MIPSLIVAIALAAGVVVWLVWRGRTRSERPALPSISEPVDAGALEGAFPAAGLLVQEDIVRTAGATSVTVWEALEASTAPVAIEYHPVSATEIAKLRTVPVNASAQNAMVQLVKALNPKSPTLYTVVLPKGKELVKAVGTSGFRGFSRTAGQTTHAVLKPVAVGSAVVAGWPVLAVAGTVMAVDMVAQRELRAHQGRVEAILFRQQQTEYTERIKDQRSADAQLTRAMSLMLDGGTPHLELALKSAYDEFHRSQLFLEKYHDVFRGLTDDEGKVDFRRLEEALGGKTRDLGPFVRELHLARAALAIRRKAMVADAASAALTDPGNAYASLRKHLEHQAAQLEAAETLADELTESLGHVRLKGRWRDTEKSVAIRQASFRAETAPAPVADDDVEITYLVTAAGEVLQVLGSEETEPAPHPTSSRSRWCVRRPKSLSSSATTVTTT